MFKELKTREKKRERERCLNKEEIGHWGQTTTGQITQVIHKHMAPKYPVINNNDFICAKVSSHPMKHSH